MPLVPLNKWLLWKQELLKVLVKCWVSLFITVSSWKDLFPYKAELLARISYLTSVNNSPKLANNDWRYRKMWGLTSSLFGWIMPNYSIIYFEAVVLCTHKPNHHFSLMKFHYDQLLILSYFPAYSECQFKLVSKYINKQVLKKSCIAWIFYIGLKVIWSITFHH